MKLHRLATTGLAIVETLDLPNDMLWGDEFSWNPVVRKTEYSLTGALLVEIGRKLLGRPISLSPPDQEMAWVSRSVAATLLAWGNLTILRMLLVLEYPEDTRQFIVSFADGDSPVTAHPVRGFPGHKDSDEFQVSIKLTEVE
jgi:hypothetical protein